MACGHHGEIGQQNFPETGPPAPSLVRRVINGVGIDARPGFRLGREDFFNGLTPRRGPPGWTR